LDVAKFFQLVEFQYVNGRTKTTLQIKTPDKSWEKYRLPFGMYKGRALSELVVKDFGYVKFMSRQRVQENESREWKETIMYAKRCVSSLNI
jgi:hypothetical protein